MNRARTPAVLLQPPTRQGGVVIFIALIAMVIMTLAGIALMRSAAPAATIAGNIAFKQTATQLSDIGVELAFQDLKTHIIPAGPQNDQPFRYAALMRDTDDVGVPLEPASTKTIDWNKLTCFDQSGDPTKTVDCHDDSLYRIQYMIDRQCKKNASNAAPDPSNEDDIQKYCVLTTDNRGNSQRSDSAQFPGPGLVVYRVTVNIQGPRKTASLIQASLSF